jgi:hypothetical protein
LLRVLMFKVNIAKVMSTTVITVDKDTHMY